MSIWTKPKDEPRRIGLLSGSFPRVVLTAETSGRMEALVSCCNIEISWLSTVIQDGNDYVVDNIIVPPQLCSIGGTTFQESSLMAMFVGEDGKIPRDVLPLIADLRAWGHSHHNMGVFASKTDEDQSTDFLNQVQKYFVRIICNKFGQINTTLYLLERDLILYHPKLICLKPPKQKAEDISAGELYPWDDWAMREIDQKVQRSSEPLHGDDFTDAEIIEFQLGRQNPDQFGDRQDAEW